ncbi:hypothetical protein [Deinococcus navajonensis]|uniref:CBS domain-containing protein n=1 Tax=Deinococcus navajonensis TaxID=309884 RepID=A0ABV8XLY9_9DEIO
MDGSLYDVLEQVLTDPHYHHPVVDEQGEGLGPLSVVDILRAQSTGEDWRDLVSPGLHAEDRLG